MLINRFSEKNSHLGKWAILGPKMAHPHNSGSGRTSLKFCLVKGTNSQMRMILIILQKKKNCLGQWTILGPKMVHPQTWIHCKKFFKFCTMKRAIRQMKVIIMVCTKKMLFMAIGKILLVVFLRKKFSWGNLIFLDFQPFFTV